MLFKRRKPLNIAQNIREFCWPAMGWRRVGQYLKLRVVRLPHSSRKIAAGLAIGVSVSFTPFIGTHIIQGVIIAYVVRASKASAALGTFIGNPWTFPFMWWAAISLGAFLFDLMGLPASTNVPAEMDFSIFIELIKNDPLRILFPWIVGGYLLALLSFPVSYGIFYNIVRAAKIARRKARLRRMHKAAKDVTGQKK